MNCKSINNMKFHFYILIIKKLLKSLILSYDNNEVFFFSLRLRSSLTILSRLIGYVRFQYLKRHLIYQFLFNLIFTFFCSIILMPGTSYCEWYHFDWCRWPIISNPIDGPAEDYYGIDWDSSARLTIYEQMNGANDPNDSSESEKASDSPSDSESDKPIQNESDRLLENKLVLNEYSTHVIFNTYKMHVLNSNDDNIMRSSLRFMATQFPSELLPKTEDHIKDPSSLFNLFLEKTEEISLKSQLDLNLLIYFRASITTYGGGGVLLGVNNVESHPMMEQIFSANVAIVTKAMGLPQK